ncbi:MAG: YitT family protein, partial [Deltaproteobacteria bacterium]|nr:YitT family protein [Deltaproteobacteria bacterium]
MQWKKQIWRYSLVALGAFISGVGINTFLIPHMVIFSVATDATRFLADLHFIDDTLLAAIYGGVISGIGGGMIFRVGGSAGGTDTIASIIKKYYSLNVGLVGFSINVFLMIVAAAL